MVLCRAVEVMVLKGFGRDAHLQQNWCRLWAEVGERILRLPKREQDILLEDFFTAILSRLTVFEKILEEGKR